jgi:signal transduction histidine kinase
MLDGLRRRLGSLRLASKLAWLSAALTAVFVATTLIPLSVSTRDATRRIVADQLGRTQRALIVNQERDLAAMQHAATLIGQNARMRAAMTDDQTGQLGPTLIATTQVELKRELENVDQDLIVIVDQNGRVFASAAKDGESLGRKTDLSTFDAVKVALDPNAPADTGAYGVLDVAPRSWSVAAVPLVSAGRTLGAVLLGERLDSTIAAVKSRFQGDVVLMAGDSTPTRSKDVEAAPLALGRNRAGVPVTLWLLQPVGSGALTAPIVAQFILYGLAAVILSGLGAALVARSLLRPLDRFVAYMKSTNPMATPSQRPDLGRASPEIRTLDDSFASLMVSLRESEEQLRQSQKLEAIGTLAGGVAHDFNNLLTVMHGYAELALMRADGDERLQRDLTQVLDATQRASRLTHQLLAFSRKQVLEPTVLDVDDVVGNLVPMLRRLIGEHIQIIFERGSQVPPIVADVGQLEQVIINLVVNARDAMPTGGTITIATGLRVAGNGLQGVFLSVRDNGIGIPPEIRERIFEPFFTTKAPGKGTGLGLSMVYGIIQQSGGTIDLESSTGKGTTFRIEFPASAAERSEQRLVASEEGIPRGTETVLLIEDEPELRELARQTLDNLGYQVIAPEHTEDGLAIAISRKVDLLLTDVVMPVMSGPTIVRRLADLGAQPPVIYMTGYADETLSEYRIDPGSTLRKPFSPSQLARVVRSALDLVKA